MIYMDNSAGTKPYPEVVDTIVDVLTNHWGNSSAEYSWGNDAKQIINDVTEQVARDINCKSEEIIWTSGACEANSLAIIGALGANSHMHFYTTHLEHTSIVEIVKNNPTGNPTFFIENDRHGRVSTTDLYQKLQKSYNTGAKSLVSVSFANSEIGTIQDIGTIANIVHDFGGVLHVDATQMYPWKQIDVKELGIDLMSVSGQKMHCVKGIGFLYVREGIKIKPMIYGSQQEGRRSGTMPTHLIAAFGKALEITRNNNKLSDVLNIRNHMLKNLMQVKGVHLNGTDISNERLPNNISLTIDGVKAETLVTMCDLMGVIIAKGSACKSYEPKPSEILLSIGLSEEQALNTIRISLDDFISIDNIELAANIITKLIARIREENE